MPDVREVPHDFIADDFLEFADARLILNAGTDGAAAGPGQYVVVLECRLPLARHIGRHPLVDDLHVLLSDHLLAGPRREAEVSIHSITFYRRQVIELR